MGYKGYKKLNVLSLRRKLGWTQEEFAKVLNIPCYRYKKIELKLRGATEEMCEQIAWIEKSAELMRQRGTLKRLVNLPLPDAQLAMLQHEMTYMELTIRNLQQTIEKLSAKVLIVQNRNRQVISQVNLLKKLKAPARIIEGVELLMLEDKKLKGYHSLENLYLLESRLAAKKAEYAYLKKKLASLPKSANKK